MAQDPLLSAVPIDDVGPDEKVMSLTASSAMFSSRGHLPIAKSN
jgi:hypothetical protein